MKKILKAAIFLAALTSFSANATTYDFSYTYNDSSVVNGTLSGDLSGSFVNNISDVHVFLNGVEFAGGNLFHAAWNTATQSWDNTIAAIVSTNASLNNFIFADADVPSDFNVSNYFYMINDPASGIGHETFATNFNNGDAALDNPTNTSWSLVQDPVQLPEPATYAMLLSGLFLLGASKRRKG
jgi:hypothetical protein